ncbi:hypothetical protein SANTM175S_01065 [Streptomyces antimycoticus]
MGLVRLAHLRTLKHQAELGYWTVREHRRRGYTDEAARAVIEWAFTRLGVERLEWSCEAGNEGSRAVARGVGFRMEGTDRAPDRPPGDAAGRLAGRAAALRLGAAVDDAVPALQGVGDIQRTSAPRHPAGRPQRRQRSERGRRPRGRRAGAGGDRRRCQWVLLRWRA